MNYVTRELRTVGDRVKWLRERAELSQEKLGKQVGVTQVAISKIESNATKKSLAETIIAIAAALRANINWIQTGKGDPYATDEPADSSEAVRLLAQCDGRKLAMATAMLKAIVEAPDE